MLRLRHTSHDRRECRDALAAATVAVIDLETTGLRRHDAIVAAGVLIERDAFVLVTDEHRELSSLPYRTSLQQLREAFAPLSSCDDLTVVLHNAAFRDAIKQARDARETTNAALIQSAVNGNLQDLTTALQALGFGADDVPKRPARYQISDELQAELREASGAVNIPATQLLAICLKRETAMLTGAAQGRRGGRRKRQKADGDAAPRKRRRRKSAEA